MTPLKTVPSYKTFMAVSQGKNGRLRLLECFLCHSSRTFDGKRAVPLVQLSDWPTLHAHIACYNVTINELVVAYPKHPFVESMK